MVEDGQQCSGVSPRLAGEGREEGDERRGESGMGKKGEEEEERGGSIWSKG